MKKYKDMTTDELRTLMRDRGVGPSVAKGTWIVHCPKKVAVAALLAADNDQPFNFQTGKSVPESDDSHSLPPLPPIPRAPEKEPTKRPALIHQPDIDSVVKAVKALAGNGRINEGQIRLIASEEAKHEVKDRTAKMFDRIVDLEQAQEAGAPTISIKINDLPEIEMDRQHFRFPLLAATAKVGVHMMLVGPAGSGKTTVAESVATLLGRPFKAISFGPTTSKADMVGYKDANGNYHETDLVRAYREGWVFLGDEMDSANAGVLTQINMALSNGHMSTPSGMVERHPDFLFIAGCNTFGIGANREYVGRNQLDAASLDRLAMIAFPIDEGLEAHACGEISSSPRFTLDKGGVPSNKEWLGRVQKVRKAVEKLQVRHIVSPRASIHGVKLIAAGVGQAHLDDIVLFKGMDEATRKKVKAECAI